MVHNAYDSFQLLTNCPARIDAVESHNSKLFAGCYDGSLRIYSPQSPSSEELRQDSYLLETTVTGFSKKPIVAMKVLASRELLLSLSESIAFHKLPNLETVAVITKAKGANAYSWDDRRGFLCFSRQKRVCVFKHDGKSLELFYSIVIKKSLDFYFYEKRKFGFLLLQEEEG